MENDFTDAVKGVLDDRKVLSENGAVMNATTGKRLLDCWFKLSSMRHMDEDEIKRLFAEAYLEDEELALRFLFYVLDVRGGAGERRSFEVMFDWLETHSPEKARRLLRFIPLYGRWDLLVRRICYGSNRDEAVKIVGDQLKEDLKNVVGGKGVSLLAKWLPSVNCHSKKTRAMAKAVRNSLGLTEKIYRKTLSTLRKAIDVVERKMSANKWGEIDYSKVPSKANLNYKDSFVRHDHDRRTEFLNALAEKKEGVKINSSACFPHDIVHRYGRCIGDDATLEEMWKALPDYVNGDETTMVVHDSSGSMMTEIGNGSLTALEVATALAVYFSERCRGAYKDRFITFSHRPKFVDLTNCKSLREKLHYIGTISEVANTDIAATMRLVLDAAVRNGLKQSDIPNLLVISDMEFDDGVCSWRSDDGCAVECAIMDKLAKEFTSNGYRMPKIAYWNVANRSGGIPCTNRDSGVTILSGFSPTAVKMALSGANSPYAALCEILRDKRYEDVAEAAV